jgi:hypothetical protein
MAAAMLSVSGSKNVADAATHAYPADTMCPPATKAGASQTQRYGSAQDDDTPRMESTRIGKNRTYTATIAPGLNTDIDQGIIADNHVSRTASVVGLLMLICMIDTPS